MPSNEDKHTERMAVGFFWVMMAMVVALPVSDAGYGPVESVAIGIVATPVLLLGIYALGVMGAWVLARLPEVPA